MSDDRQALFNLAQFMAGFSHASRMRGNSMNNNNRSMMMDDDDFFIPDHIINQDHHTNSNNNNNGRQRRIIFMNSGNPLLESLALQNSMMINPRNESAALNDAKQLPRAQNLAYDEDPTNFVDNPYSKDKVVDTKILDLRRFV
ncbi:hypothetical protein C9374_013546 [Naegleria lovaniensis]|uniref:Uncharacterized protein n=1 Tax=Naegleria lovaniensis TaxID=51637 RepID=A0AA88KQ21_NAELO|nr:uncharacterized protein C9374_013546 [Naegleria lovaniensis]KAG2392061.1 hypothetical protein C9374_013546 [Naegleria lovaniensis]